MKSRSFPFHPPFDSRSGHPAVCFYLITAPWCSRPPVLKGLDSLAAKCSFIWSTRLISSFSMLLDQSIACLETLLAIRNPTVNPKEPQRTPQRNGAGMAEGANWILSRKEGFHCRRKSTHKRGIAPAVHDSVRYWQWHHFEQACKNAVRMRFNLEFMHLVHGANTEKKKTFISRNNQLATRCF